MSNRPREHTIFSGIKQGDLLAVQQAVESDPPPSQADLDSAAAWAIRAHHLDIVRYLLNNGVSITNCGVQSATCHAKSLEIFQIMYDHGWKAEQINDTLDRIEFM
jgi:hypothetical protein